MRPIDAAAAEESRHAGFAHCHGIKLHKVVARLDGSGLVEIATPTRSDLEALYAHDTKLARDVVGTYCACAIIGHGATEDLSPGDQAMVDRFAGLWHSLAGGSCEGLMLSAELRATSWLLRHKEAVDRFAHVLAEHSLLMGAELQRRLVQAFGEPSQHVLLGRELHAWLAHRQAEAEAVRAAERRAAAERACRAADLYAWAILGNDRFLREK